jgi:hypothetical protein
LNGGRNRVGGREDGHGKPLLGAMLLENRMIGTEFGESSRDWTL